MSISRVKNNMYQSYSSCIALETNINQLVSIINSVDGSTTNRISSYIPTIDYSLNIVIRNFNTMLSLNRAELHILFSEFNSKNSDMNFKLNTLKSKLSVIKKLSIEKYKQYIYFERMEFLVDDWVYNMVMNTSDLKFFIPSLNSFINELMMFKMMIDRNNRKLRMGVRR